MLFLVSNKNLCKYGYMGQLEENTEKAIGIYSDSGNNHFIWLESFWLITPYSLQNRYYGSDICS